VERVEGDGPECQARRGEDLADEWLRAVRGAEMVIVPSCKRSPCRGWKEARDRLILAQLILATDDAFRTSLFAGDNDNV
jgi:hypothetical protein